MSLVFHNVLLVIDGLAGLVRYLTVLFFFCNFFLGLALLKAGRKLSFVLGYCLVILSTQADNFAICNNDVIMT